MYAKPEYAMIMPLSEERQVKRHSSSRVTVFSSPALLHGIPENHFTHA
jgi:hypothetical protein